MCRNTDRVPSVTIDIHGGKVLQTALIVLRPHEFPDAVQTVFKIGNTGSRCCLTAVILMVGVSVKPVLLKNFRIFNDFIAKF
jgi:hypothetical protein